MEKRFTLFNLEGTEGCVPTQMLMRWGFSSAGRAPALQAGGQRFDPANLHQRQTEVKKSKDGPIAQLARAHD